MTIPWMIDRVIAHEGGYVNDPADPGGETKYGISKRAYPQLDIKNLTRDAAAAIYERDYFTSAKLYMLPDPLAYCVLDFGVNVGTSRAVKALQRVLGVSVDGVVGKGTAAAVEAVRDPYTLVAAYQRARTEYYVSLNKPRFLQGWLNRTIDVTVTATKMIGD